MTGTRFPTIALALTAILAGSASGCRTAQPTSGAPGKCPGDGMLIVRNYSGRVLEVYESGIAGTEFIGFASPGVTRMRVGGASELGVTYRVREPAEGRDAATVTWIRRSAVAQSSRLALELACA